MFVIRTVPDGMPEKTFNTREEAEEFIDAHEMPFFNWYVLQVIGTEEIYDYYIEEKKEVTVAA